MSEAGVDEDAEGVKLRSWRRTPTWASPFFTLTLIFAAPNCAWANCCSSIAMINLVYKATHDDLQELVQFSQTEQSQKPPVYPKTQQLSFGIHPKRHLPVQSLSRAHERFCPRTVVALLRIVNDWVQVRFATSWVHVSPSNSSLRTWD